MHIPRIIGGLQLPRPPNIRGLGPIPHRKTETIPRKIRSLARGCERLDQKTAMSEQPEQPGTTAFEDAGRAVYVGREHVCEHPTVGSVGMRFRLLDDAARRAIVLTDPTVGGDVSGDFPNVSGSLTAPLG